MTALPTLSAPAWFYQPPHSSPDYATQLFYRSNGIRMDIPGATSLTPSLQLFRWRGQPHVQIDIDIARARVNFDLDRPAMQALRDALNDALMDIDAEHPGAQRQAATSERKVAA